MLMSADRLLPVGRFFFKHRAQRIVALFLLIFTMQQAVFRNGYLCFLGVDR